MTIENAKNLKIGTQLISNENPKWGIWRITEITHHDGIMWYDIKSEYGNERTMSPYDVSRGYFKVIL